MYRSHVAWHFTVRSGQLRQSFSIAHRFKIVTPAVTLIAVASALIAAPVVIGVFTAAADFTDCVFIQRYHFYKHRNLLALFADIIYVCIFGFLGAFFGLTVQQS